ncbi:MAG TPA: hypothetical protein VIO14_01825 [Dehalococcoidia bacterium]
MFTRITALAPWFTHSGLVSLLVGLAWDGILHRADPGLAAREGIVAPSNPGHVLLGLGIALLVIGALLGLASRALRSRGTSALRRAAVLAPAVALLALASTSFALALSTEGVAGTGHSHVHEHATAEDDDGHDHEHATEDGGHDHDTGAPSAGESDAERLAGGLVHTHPDAVPISAADLAFAADLVQRVRAESGTYTDVRTAEAAGYRPVTKGPLVHYTNPQYLADGRMLDPAYPESLIYLQRPGRSLELVGVMFQTRPGQEPPAQGATVMNWHRHTNLCISTSGGGVAGLADQDGTCPAGSVLREDTGSMIHLWLVDTPAGVFADGMEVVPYLLGRKAPSQ